jgi:hypothetical protein
MRQIGFQDAAAQSFGRASDLIDGSDDGPHQLVHVERTTVGEVAFCQRPNVLVGIEVGRVGWKVLDVQARVAAEELGERRSGVRGGIVQQNDDRAAKVAQQFLEEEDDFFLPDVVEEKQVVEAQAMSLGAEGDSRDDGDFIPASLAMVEKGSGTLGSPSSHHQRSQEEARFIGKN